MPISCFTIVRQELRASDMRGLWCTLSSDFSNDRIRACLSQSKIKASTSSKTIRYFAHGSDRYNRQPRCISTRVVASGGCSMLAARRHRFCGHVAVSLVLAYTPPEITKSYTSPDQYVCMWSTLLRMQESYLSCTYVCAVLASFESKGRYIHSKGA